MSSALHHRRHGAVLVTTIDRPERRNALDPPTMHALVATLRDATDDAAVRAVVLTAVGEACFCSGMDLHALAADRRAAGRAVAELQEALWSPERPPIVAAVNGPAVGGGFELALACDLVVAADHAHFGLPEVTRGLLAGGGATLLPARLPIAVALELGLTGLPVGAERAASLGLVNRVVPPAELEASALELAERIAANAPLAVAWTRRAMWATLREGTGAGWAQTRAGQEVVGRSADLAEGLAAFRDRRQPRFRGA